MIPSLIAEYLLGGDAADGAYPTQGLHVEFLLVAQNDGAIGLAGHLLLLELDDVLQCEVGDGFVDALVPVVVNAQSLCCQPGVDEPELGGALGGQALGQGFLGNEEEGSLCGMESRIWWNWCRQSIILSFCVIMCVKKYSVWSSYRGSM